MEKHYLKQGSEFHFVVDFGDVDLSSGYTFDIEFRSVDIGTNLLSFSDYITSKPAALSHGKFYVYIDGTAMANIAIESCVFEVKAKKGEKVHRPKLYAFSVEKMVIDQPFDLVTVPFIYPVNAAHYKDLVSSTTVLANIPSIGLTASERRFVTNEISDYFYYPDDTSGDVAPVDQVGGTGFWRKQSSSSETAASVLSKFQSNADANVLTDDLFLKLNDIEANATADQTAAEIATLVAAENDVNFITDAEKTKIADAALASDLTNKVDKRLSRANKTGANYLIKATDFVLEGLDMNRVTSIAVNITDNTVEPCPVGVDLELIQVAAGDYTINIASGASSAVLHTTENKSPGQYKPIILRQIALDEWIVIGGIA